MYYTNIYILIILKAKLEMIESLMEIQIAYNMMEIKTTEDSMLHPLDTHYLKLNCVIDVSYIFIS